MGYLNSFYNAGPGVSKDERKKKGFFVYFEVLGAKFFKLIKANIIYFLASILYIVLAIFFLAPLISNGFGLESILSGLEDAQKAKSIIYTILSCWLLNFFGAGPASAGYAFVTRCFTRREYTWVFSDGWDKFKENFLSSVKLLVTDIIVIFILMNAISIYSQISDGNVFYMFLRYLLMVIFFVYMMAHIFTYQIMVTYECKFKDIIKTSIIMAIANLPVCVLLIIITGAILLLISNLGLFTPAVFAILGMSFTRFPLEFYATRVIDKNIRMVKKKSAIRESETKTTERADKE